MPNKTRENTVTGLITEFLRNSGVHALGPVGLTVPGEWPQEPDFEVRNGGVFIGEAKWEKDYYKGIAEAHDYMRSPAVNGAFAIAYPDDLRSAIDQADLLKTSVDQVLEGYEFRVAFLSRSSGTDLRRLRLEELPEWIKGHIHEKVRPRPAPGEVITVLQQVAEALTKGIETVDAPDLFKNVLGVQPTKSEQEVAARRAAGFLLVNQVTFYRVLSSARAKYPDLDPYSIGDPSDFQSYFDRVLEDNYSAIFSFPVASFYSHTHLHLLRSAIHSIYGLGPEQINHEVLGTVFHALTPLSVRKPLGAFYTLHKAAELLAHLAVADANVSVLDPACGAGQLLTAAYERKRDLLGTLSESDHRRFLEKDITGIDIMPFAAHLSTIHLAMEAPAYQTDHVRIGIEDSTTLRPGQSIAPLSYVLPESLRGQREIFGEDDDSNPMVQTGGISLKGVSQEPIDLGKVDLVIMNPPFSRQESIAAFSKDYKGLLKERFQRRRAHQLHGKMNFSGYFLFLADRFLESDGRLASVLPASVLVNSSDSGVREMLLSEYSVRVLIAREDEPRFSEDTDHQEILLMADKGEPSQRDRVTIVTVKNLSAVLPAEVKQADESLREAANSDRELAQADLTAEGQGFIARSLEAGDLNVHNMFAPIAVQNFELFTLWRTIKKNERLTRLDDLDTGLIRGGSSHPWQDGALSSSDSHLEAGDSWVVDTVSDKEVTVRHRHVENEAVAVPAQGVRPYLLRYSHRGRMDLTGISEFVVVEKFNEFSRFRRLGDADPMPDGWKSHVEAASAHMGLMRRCDLTASGTRHMCFYDDKPRAYHRMWCLPNLSANHARLLVLWFNSSLGLLQFLLNRVPGRGGWTNYRKFLVTEFLALDPSQVSHQEVRALEKVFDEVREAEFPSLAAQFLRLVPSENLSAGERRAIERAYPEESEKLGQGFRPRMRIDKAIADVLDVDEEAGEVLDELYPQLLSELVSLKLMMA